VATSASNYINKIDVTFPRAGQDNDSQPFRDNFTNIKQALASTDSLVNTLKLGLVTTSTVNDFGFNNIVRANFQNCSVTINDDAANNTRSQAVTINYANGSYQKFKIDKDTTTFSVINWPYRTDNTTGLGGRLQLSITPVSSAATAIAFPANYIPVGETVIPFDFSSQLPVFFELWTDDGGSTVYVNQIGYKSGVVATGTDIIALNSLKIGTNVYTTGTEFSTVVTVPGDQPKIGRLGVLRDVFTTTISPITSYTIDLTTASYFVVSNADRIYAGSIINFAGTSTSFEVASVEGTKIYTIESFNVNPTVVFTTGTVVASINPKFNQPDLLSITDRVITSSAGSSGDLKGQVYVTTSSIFIAHADFSDNQNNWLQVYGKGEVDNLVSGINNTIGSALTLANGTTATTQIATDNTTKVATDAFVHSVIPRGVILMWSGSVVSVPLGWALCDGNNGTPNLLNKFVIGAGDSYGVNAAADATMGAAGAHSHGGNTNASSVTIDNAGWGSAGTYFGAGTAGTLVVASGVGESVEILESLLQSGGSRTTGNHSHVINSDGSHTHSFMPPYYALAYIMKTSG
jgi:hypothetical protein